MARDRWRSIWVLVFLVFPILENCGKVMGDEPAKESIRTPEKVSFLKISFQNGVDEYAGAVDTEIWALAPTTLLESNPNASADANNDGGESQVLIRFDGVFGESSKSIPLGSRIVTARLLVSAFDQGNTVNLHRMLVPFPKSATWSSMVDGVSADGLEASRQKDSFTFGKIAANTSVVLFDVTDTLQAWSSGQANHGWVFLNTGGNGWDFYSSEFDDLHQRPKLVVEYEAPVKPSFALSSKGASSDESSKQR